MKFISWNVNGFRAALKKNFWQNLPQTDFFCLQEIKTDHETMKVLYDDYLVFEPEFVWDWFSSQRKGYSGVLIGFRKALLENQEIVDFSFEKGLGIEKFDTEGRVLILKFTTKNQQKIALINGYYPQGGRGQGRIDYKLEFYQQIVILGKRLQNEGYNLILTGDLNTTVWDIDLARPKQNRKTTGCLPEERLSIGLLIDLSPEIKKWYDENKFYENHIQASDEIYNSLNKKDKLDLIDSFRYFNPETADKYTYWDQITRARTRNVGWRIDYFLVDKNLQKQIQKAEILDQVLGSDHCPVLLELDL